MKNSIDNPQIDIVLDTLLDKSKPFPPEFLHIFSDISTQDLEAVTAKWDEIPETRKIFLLTELVSLMKEDSLILCNEFGEFALSDKNPSVRVNAIELLGECEDPRLIKKHLVLLEEDASLEVRKASAAVLGNFILLGELGEIRGSLYELIFNRLMNVFESGQSDALKQEILQSIAYAERKKISKIIIDAYQKDDKGWKLAAITAMGRSADSRWESEILKSFGHTDAAIELAAVKAAGELNLVSARNTLLEKLEGEPLEIDYFREIILALTKIGGSETRKILEYRLETLENDEEIEIIEEALEIIDYEDQLPDLDL